MCRHRAASGSPGGDAADRSARGRRTVPAGRNAPPLHSDSSIVGSAWRLSKNRLLLVPVQLLGGPWCRAPVVPPPRGAAPKIASCAGQRPENCTRISSRPRRTSPTALAAACAKPGILPERNLYRHVELGVVLLHVTGAVLGPEHAGDPADPGAVLDEGDLPGRPSRPFGRKGNRPILQQILVPLRVGALHWKEVQRLAVFDKPHGERDFPAGRSAGDRDLDLVRALERLGEISERHVRSS